VNNIIIDELIKLALKEDIGFGDATGEAIFDEADVSEGILLAKEDFVIAGVDVFSRVFQIIDRRVSVTLAVRDGDGVKQGEKLAILEGPTKSILAGERVALNYLQHLSGVATKTKCFVEAAKGQRAVVVDTRKTTPGLRMLEKYAVKVGGGQNHRFGLDSMILIKDNHIKAAGGIRNAVAKVKKGVSPFLKIEVEVESLEGVREALAANVDIIMLDNMLLGEIKSAVSIINGKVLVEVSGNVTLERIGELAAAGVDIISSGALTHSVKAADISLRLV